MDGARGNDGDATVTGVKMMFGRDMASAALTTKDSVVVW